MLAASGLARYNFAEETETSRQATLVDLLPLTNSSQESIMLHAHGDGPMLDPSATSGDLLAQLPDPAVSHLCDGAVPL